MPKVTMVFGLLASGKTTLADRLAGSGVVRLSLDEQVIAASGDRQHLDEHVQDRVAKQLMKLWPQLIQAGVDVVLDFGFWRRGLRDEVRSLAAATGADVELLWVQCDEAERRRRCLDRSASSQPEAYDIDAEAFDWIESNRVIDRPTEDEHYRVVDTRRGLPK